MRCRDAQRQLGAYDYAAFDPEKLPEALREHLDTCATCQQWLAGTRQLSGMLRDLPSAEMQPDFTRRVMAAIKQPRPSLWQRWLPGFTGALRAPAPLIPTYQLVAAACLLLVLVVGAALYTGPFRTQAIDTGVGVVAADGTSAGSTGIPVSAGAPALRVTGRDLEPLKLDDLIMRHQNYELARPLGPDPGVRQASEASY